MSCFTFASGLVKLLCMRACAGRGHCQLVHGGRLVRYDIISHNGGPTVQSAGASKVGTAVASKVEN